MEWDKLFRCRVEFVPFFDLWEKRKQSEPPFVPLFEKRNIRAEFIVEFVPFGTDVANLMWFL